MTAQIIDGKAVAAKVQEQVRLAIEARVAKGLRPPALATVLVGADPASQVYVRNKRETCKRVGVRSVPVELPATISQAALLAEVARLNVDPGIDGILVQLPLPAPLDGEAVVATIDPAKDVDGLTPVSAGLLTLGQPGLVPCTPAGSMRLLDEAGCDPKGKHAVVVGRSVLVGKPIAQLLLARHATVTIAHSRTVDLGKVVADGDIVIAAVGKEALVRGAWIKPGAVVIDVGINRTAEGKLRGDVEFEAAKARAGWITPVPGGVGPMTVAMLMQNTLLATERRERR